MSSLRGKIIAVLVELRGGRISLPDEIESVHLKDLGIDSLYMMKFISQIEKEFRITILDDDINPQNFVTVGDVERIVAKYITFD